MNYFIKKADEKNFDLIEQPTNLVVQSFTDYKSANKIRNLLNYSKAGFQGATPPFFAIKKAS